MKNPKALFFVFIFITALPDSVFSQNHLEILVQDSASNEFLNGVNVLISGTLTGTITNENGLAILNNIPDGSHELILSYIGYQKSELKITFPLKDIPQPLLVLLTREAESIEEVTVTATRNNSRIEDLPTKIEVLGLDDMLEENTIKPANISSLLGDIAGIQMQQISASSGNLNARIQGLNGRYSQILKDGMPLYGGFSGSFSLLQIPPLDLRQIEIIKGSASTLFGGDAIGGIINLVSKKPGLKPETSFLINETSFKETDINSYISRKYKNTGFTTFAGYTYQNPVDVNKDGFSDVPGIRNFIFHPKLFIYFGKNTTLSAGVNSTFESRKGGDMTVIQHSANAQHQYFVKHQSIRNTGDLIFNKKMETGSEIIIKGCASILDRNIETSQYNFNALQTIYFSEFSYLLKKNKYDFVFGLNLNGDNFNTVKRDSILITDYHYSTIGLFVQNDWHITEKILIESGFRYDYHSSKGSFMLPRLSLMYKFSPRLTSRINGGLGYKVPLIFSYINEETELEKISTSQFELKTETSEGINFDLNYSSYFENDVSLTLNQSFFYTILNHPIVYLAGNTDHVYLGNADKPVETKGFQTYLRMGYSQVELYISYVYTHVEKKYDHSNPWFLATPQHNLSGTFTYEPSVNWRFGIENSLIGPQFIENNATTPAYDFLAAMIERKFRKISFVLNCENILDYRQKDYLLPPIINPGFKTIWAPIDGRVFNLSVNLKF